MLEATWDQNNIEVYQKMSQSPISYEKNPFRGPALRWYGVSERALNWWIVVYILIVSLEWKGNSDRITGMNIKIQEDRREQELWESDSLLF